MQTTAELILSQSQPSEYNDTESDTEYDYIEQQVLEPFVSQLRPHQEDAIDFMNNNNTGVMQLFCGTGKSKIMYEFMIQQIRKYKKFNTLIVIPSLALIAQFNESYILNQENKDYLKQNKIDLNVNIIDKDHETAFKPEFLENSANLIIISYQSLDKVKNQIEQFNLFMFDEAHHICTKLKIAFIKQILTGQVFYFTATPKINKKLLDMYGNTNNPINCGQVFKYDFRTAVQDGWVVDYQLNFCIYKQIEENPEISNIKDQFNALVSFAETHKRTRIIAFNQYINKTSDYKTNSNAFAALGTKQNKVEVRVICGTTQVKTRQDIFNWFQQDDYKTTKVIFNASCIKEGIDLPCTDLVVFCDNKQSPIQIVQCIGRTTRVSNNKQHALITAMIPQKNISLVVDKKKDEFLIVTNICKALKDSDTQMRDIMDQGRLNEFIKFTNSNTTQLDQIEYNEFIDRVIVQLDEKLNHHGIILDKIVKYALEHNNKLPTFSQQNMQDTEIAQMTRWLSSKKKGYKQDELDRDLKIAIETKLKGFGFVWEVDQLKEHYYKLDRILEYCKKNNKLPTSCDKDNEIKQMGNWLSNRKEDYKGNLKRNKQRTLDKDLKIAIETKLKGFGFVWEVDQLQEWYLKLDNVVKYALEHNNTLPIPNNQDYDIRSLGIWLSMMKVRNKDNTLDEGLKLAIENKLNQFGFKWVPEQLHYIKLDKVVEYALDHNNELPIYTNQDPVIRSLGNWLTTMKSSKKANILDEDLIHAIEDKLTQFGFKWEVDRLQKWYFKLDKVVKYAIENNHKLPMQSDQDPDIYSLSQWLTKQKIAKKTNALDEDLIYAIEDKLTQFGFKWEVVYLQECYLKLEKLVKYALEHNNKLHMKTNSDPDIKSLKAWLGKMKMAKKANTLDEDIKLAIEDKLTQFGFKWEVDKLQQYYLQLDEVVKYSLEHNNKLPSTEDQNIDIRSLATWLSKMRAANRDNTLDEDLKLAIDDKLTQFGFKWNINYISECYLKLDKVVKYALEHNNKLPSTADQELIIRSLGRWLSKMRAANRDNTLDEDLKLAIDDKLTQFGFKWEVDKLQEWYQKLDKIVKYALEHNNRLPTCHESDSDIRSLGKWLSSMKYAKRDNTLDEGLKLAIEDKLTQFGFKWEVDKLQEWYLKLDGVVEYALEHNNRLPTCHESDSDIRSLGKWLSHMKTAKKANTLDEDLKHAIEDKLIRFGFVWEGRAQKVTVQPKKCPESIIMDTHQSAFTSNIETLVARFKNNPQQLIEYHEARELSQSKHQNKDQLPHNIIIKVIQSIRPRDYKSVIDLGCGLNKIAEYFKDNELFKFTSIDLQILPNAFKDNIQQGDISNLPQIKDESYGNAIMSLCFWGLDFKCSIEECYRILEDGGYLYIVQCNRKMEGFYQILKDIGFIKLKEYNLEPYVVIICIKQGPCSASNVHTWVPSLAGFSICMVEDDT